MPDVFVPLKDDKNNAYLNRLLRKNTLFEYAFDYTDRNRQELSKYETPEEFIAGFKVSDPMFQDLVNRAKNEGIEGTKAERRKSEYKIRTLIKAYIGRNLLDDPAFYPIYLKIDDTFQKGYQVVREEAEP